MATERNAIEELDYLSGSILAHEVYLTHVSKMLVASGIITERDLRSLVMQLSDTEMDSFELPELRAGFKDALQKIHDGIPDN